MDPSIITLVWKYYPGQAFSATTVSAGQGLGVVVATGDNAEIGKINRLVSTVEDVKTNLVIQVIRITC